MVHPSFRLVRSRQAGLVISPRGSFRALLSKIKRLADHVAVHESPVGLPRHLVRRSEMSAIGCEADVACARSK